MVEFIFSHTDSKEFLKAMAMLLKTEVKDDTLLFPGNFATGFIKAFKLINGLQGTILEGTLKQDFFFQRKKDGHNFYILHFDQMQLPSGLITMINDVEIEHAANVRSAVLLTSSLFNFSYFLPTGSQTKSITIYIDEEWLIKYLGIDSTHRLLKDYLLLKSARLNFEPLDAEYRYLLNEIFEETEHPFKNLVLENRIPMLVELFFTRIHDKLNSLDKVVSISSDEMQRLMAAEARLVDDATRTAPSIKELSRLAVMSESKFKLLFKKVYGNSPYEYFQRNRMTKGGYLLKTKRYTVKEVGEMLGYSNLSNFTIAFKKEFGMLPSEV
ncbi:MAG: helix-turn-helix transcriptional regulator [Ferruginibacter sp.]